MFAFLLAITIGLAIGGLLGWHTYLVLTAQTTIDYYSNDYDKKMFRLRGEVW